MFKNYRHWLKSFFSLPVKIEINEGKRQVGLLATSNIFIGINFEEEHRFYSGLVAECPYLMASQQFDEARASYKENYIETLFENIRQLNLDSFFTDYFDTMDFTQTPGYFCAHIFGNNQGAIFERILRYSGSPFEKVFYGLTRPIEGWNDKIIKFNNMFVENRETLDEFEFNNYGVALIGGSVESIPIISCPLERKDWLVDYVTSFIRRVGREYVFANFTKGE